MSDPIPSGAGVALLDQIIDDALDPDYARVTAERPTPPVEATGSHHRLLRVTPRAAVVVVLLGLLVATAAVQRQQNSQAISESRESLTARITSERARLDDRQQYLADLRRATNRLSESVAAVGGSGEDAVNDVRDIGTVTGFAQVVGPGVVATLTSAPDSEVRNGIQDGDLALFVNALWTAGAEALSVNGQRVTAQSSIRTSGSAIEVNSVAISEPYVVRAIGDPGALEPDFFNTSTGLAFDGLARQFGWTYGFDSEEQLRLSAAPDSVRIVSRVAVIEPSTSGEGLQ